MWKFIGILCLSNWPNNLSSSTRAVNFVEYFCLKAYCCGENKLFVTKYSLSWSNITFSNTLEMTGNTGNRSVGFFCHFFFGKSGSL